MHNFKQRWSPVTNCRYDIYAMKLLAPVRWWGRTDDFVGGRNIDCFDNVYKSCFNYIIAWWTSFVCLKISHAQYWHQGDTGWTTRSVSDKIWQTTGRLYTINIILTDTADQRTQHTLKHVVGVLLKLSHLQDVSDRSGLRISLYPELWYQ